MKFNKSNLDNNQLITLEEDINFKEVRPPILSLNNLHVKAEISRSDNLINVYFFIKGKAKVTCAYTLEPIDYPLDFEDSIDISDSQNNIDAYFIKSNIVDLNPIILDLVVGEIPTKVVKKGAKIKVETEGVRVISEEDLRKERDSSYNPKFDKLKDVDL